MDRRAPAPQRQRHHHRPVISFKEQGMRTKQQAESSDALHELGPPGPVVVSLILVPIATNSPLTASFSFSNTQTRDRCFVFLSIRIGKHALLELVQLPDFQVSQIAEHRYIADHCGAFS